MTCQIHIYVLKIHIYKKHKVYISKQTYHIYKIRQKIKKMAEKKRTKTRYVDVNVNKGNFVSKLIRGDSSHDFSDVKLLRKAIISSCISESRLWNKAATLRN